MAFRAGLQGGRNPSAMSACRNSGRAACKTWARWTKAVQHYHAAALGILVGEAGPARLQAWMEGKVGAKPDSSRQESRRVPAAAFFSLASSPRAWAHPGRLLLVPQRGVRAAVAGAHQAQVLAHRVRLHRDPLLR